MLRSSYKWFLESINAYGVIVNFQGMTLERGVVFTSLHEGGRIYFTHEMQKYSFDPNEANFFRSNGRTWMTAETNDERFITIISDFSCPYTVPLTQSEEQWYDSSDEEEWEDSASYR